MQIFHWLIEGVVDKWLVAFWTMDQMDKGLRTGQFHCVMFFQSASLKPGVQKILMDTSELLRAT